ncbi:MAG: GNAT family N-acetyltransferase [Anaerolineales bacterium]|nr:GNAT family N-acetyltransferase [Anaerolineales bacterium]
MKNISTRVYSDEKDFQTMVDLIAKVRPPGHLNDYPVKVDLEENLASEAVRANTRLWFDGDQPIGWASVDDGNNLHWELDQRYEEALGAQIVEWGEACIRKILGKGEATTLDASCREDYAARIAFLKRHGFQQTEGMSVHLVRDLSKPTPEPKLPPGFTIRPLAGTHEAEAVAAMHRLAFGTDYMTTENRLAIMNTSEYDLSLDLVVIAPDGTIVANCICSIEQEKNGFTDPVATHPRYQGMGLGRALLARGMQLLKEHGAQSAQFGTRDDNLAMQKAGASVGFTIEHKTIWLSKEVR